MPVCNIFQRNALLTVCFAARMEKTNVTYVPMDTDVYHSSPAHEKKQAKLMNSTLLVNVDCSDPVVCASVRACVRVCPSVCEHLEQSRLNHNEIPVPEIRQPQLYIHT